MADEDTMRERLSAARKQRLNQAKKGGASIADRLDGEEIDSDRVVDALAQS